MTIDILINTYNNEKNILNIYNKLFEDLKDLKYNIIFIDDCSTDKTLDVLKNIYKKNESSVKIIKLSKKSGKNNCFYAGLTYAKHDLVLIYDLDLQIASSHIIKMYEYINLHEDVDQVCVRLNNKKNVLFKTMNKYFKLNLDNNNTYVRLFKKNVLHAVLKASINNYFSNYLFDFIGFNTYYYKIEKKYENKTNDYTILRYVDIKKHILLLNGIMFLVISLLLILLSLLKVLHISNNTLLILLLFNYSIKCLIKYFYKKIISNNNYYISKSIGFEEKIL